MVDLAGRDTTEPLGVRPGPVGSVLYAPVTMFLRLRARLKGDVRRRWRWTAAVERLVFWFLARGMLGTPRGAQRGKFEIPQPLKDQWFAPGPVRRAVRNVRGRIPPRRAATA
jgi:hypothetical protein